jgi:hypothetical protein
MGSKGTMANIISVYEHYFHTIGKAPRDPSLIKLPVDTSCGRECVEAIDMAHEVMMDAKPTARRRIEDALTAMLSIYLRGRSH